jgi:alcohol dehydrogenase (cytochrome c)
VKVQTGEAAKPSPGLEWPLVGGDTTNRRYSTLTQINTATVKNLGGSWVKKFDGGASSRATPVVVDGRMFISAGPSVIALDPKTGETLWTWQDSASTDVRQSTDKSSDLNAVVQGGIVLPGAAGVGVGDGLVFVGLTDGHVVALTQQTGELVWKRQTGDDPPKKGQQVTLAPTFARGTVFTGLANGDNALRGRVVALNAKTGEQLWRFFTIPGPGEKGHETWPQYGDVYKRAGAGVWQVGAVDPELGLVYFGTGNAVPQTGGEIRPGDNLFTNSVLALDMKTGQLKWHYQLVHHDVWDVDLPTPIVLYDAQVRERSSKALAVLRPDGYLFLLDRENGKPIFPVQERPVPQNRRLKTAATQPFPVGADSVAPACETWRDKVPAGFELGCQFTPPYWDTHNIVAPGFGFRVVPMSYSPQTGYFYAQGVSSLGRRRRLSDDPWAWLAGGAGGGSLPPFLSTSIGRLVAIDSRTNKIIWKKETLNTRYGGGSGPLTTAGGLLFRGGGDGNFEAYDAKTGELLWQFQTGIAFGRGPASTYEVAGEQYIALSLGNVLWTFKIGGTVTAQAAPRMATIEQGPIENTHEIETASLVGQTWPTGGRRYAMDEYSFNPVRARVKAGRRVLFTNNGMMVHTVTGQDGSWSTGPLSPAQEAYVTFDNPGTYTYACKEHPWSIGQLVVVP